MGAIKEYYHNKIESDIKNNTVYETISELVKRTHPVNTPELTNEIEVCEKCGKESDENGHCECLESFNHSCGGNF